MLRPAHSRAGGIPLRILLVAAILALAGCVAGEEPAAEVEPDPAPAVDEAAAPPEPEPAAPLEPRDVPFSYAGRTGNWVCAPSGPGSSSGLPIEGNSENTLFVLEHEGTPTTLPATDR